MHNSEIHIVLNIDPAKTTPEEAVEWAITWAAKVNTAAASGATTVGAGLIFGLDKQLGRLTDHQPVFAPRVRRVHETLVKLGYTPTLPKSEKKELPSYVSYLDPDNGVNFGNLNSETFHVMRNDLRDELAALPHFGANKRYARCHLVTEEAVDALLKIAEREKK
jgi:hypothetical protein